MQNDKNLVWIDMEMTGLDPDTDRVLEIATLITDNELEIVAEGPVLAVFQPKAVLQSMNAWCQEHHSQSGLLERVWKEGVSEREAEVKTLGFIKEYVPQGASPLCGNSVGQDRRFLYRYMPELQGYFHYRTLDVSSLKILAQRWYGETLPPFQKREAHLALEDIRESIAELRYYRKHLLK